MQNEVLPVPSNMLGKLIGKGGAMKKKIESTFNVQLKIPGKNMSSGPQAQVTIVGKFNSNMTGAKQKIWELTSANAGGGGGGGFGGGTFGGPGSAFGAQYAHGGAHGGGGGGGGNSVQGYIFRVSTQTKELQLLLLNQHGKWNAPKTVYQGDAQSQAPVKLLEFLQVASGALGTESPQTTAVPVNEIEPAGGDGQIKTYNRTTKIHLMVPPRGDWLTWVPSPLASNCQQHGIDPTATGLTVAGEPQQCQFGHAFVDIGALQADTSIHTDLKRWLKHDAAPIVQGVQGHYRQITGDATVAKITLRQGGGAGSPGVPGSPQRQDGWTATPEGRAVVENFYQMCKEMAGMPPPQFLQAVDKCFEPNALQQACREYQQATQKALPNPGGL